MKMDDLGGTSTTIYWRYTLSISPGTHGEEPSRFPSFFLQVVAPSCMVEGPCDVGQGTQRCDASPFLLTVKTREVFTRKKKTT